MGQLSVAPSATSAVILPVRPAFGTKGSPVVLWANYFALHLKNVQPLYKYGLTVTHVPPPNAAPQPNRDPKQAKGAKLGVIVKAALAKLENPGPIATEFKAHLISLKKLKEDSVHVQYRERGRDDFETWKITFGTPVFLHVEELMNYLTTLKDPANDPHFPKFASEIDALGVILGHQPRQPRDDEDSLQNVVSIGAGRFFGGSGDLTIPTGSLISILRGYYQSVRPATGRLLLNVQVTHGVFRRHGPLKDICRELGLDQMNQVARYGTRQGWNVAHVRMERKLRDLNKILARAKAKVKVFYGGKPRVVTKFLAGVAIKTDAPRDQEENIFTNPRGFPWACPYTTYFFIKEPPTAAERVAGIQYNKHITVAEYYKKRYNVTADGGLPLINTGTLSRPVFMLAELIELENLQPLKTKLTPEEQSAMITFACRPAVANAHSISTTGRGLLQLDGNDCINAFGVTVDKDLITVKGRELAPPTLVYKDRRGLAPLTPAKGQWNLRNIQVVKSGSPIKKWTYVFDGTRPQPVQGAVRESMIAFARMMIQTGVDIAPQPFIPGVGVRYEDAPGLTTALSELEKKQPDLVVIVLPDRDAKRYANIKTACDVRLGFHNVCVIEAKLTKNEVGYFANVALKVNLKLGGVNHSLRSQHKLISGGSTMVVGYDVTHPTNLGVTVNKKSASHKDKGGKTKEKKQERPDPPSIVGLVSSIDKDLAQWPAQSWNNPPTKEMLDGALVDAFKLCLARWERGNKTGQKSLKPLPQNIVIFRDGVSEGQFQKVINEELPFIKQACRETYKGRQPRITVIVSVKRHQTRFFPTDKDHLVNLKSKSPKEGTVVDRGVTQARYWDFFLQAHASLQGKQPGRSPSSTLSPKLLTRTSLPGTARPAHYTVLYDEIFRADYGANAADELEDLTHSMCYLYGRATKAVSICPPAYYADLVCERARGHKNELFDMDDHTPWGSMAGSITSNDSAIRDRAVHPKLAHTMYYI